MTAIVICRNGSSRGVGKAGKANSRKERDRTTRIVKAVISGKKRVLRPISRGVFLLIPYPTTSSSGLAAPRPLAALRPAARTRLIVRGQ